MNIDLYTKNLIKKDGIWYSTKKAAISYPDEGNEHCFQIEDNSFWFRHRNNCIVEVLKKYPPKGAFFDVGGGNGFVAKAVQDIGMETILVEPGEKGCINAKKRKVENVICATIENAGFEKSSIPAIGVFDVVEHFENDKALLENLNGFLQKDGLLYITVPCHEFLWSNEDDDAGHYNRYTIKSLSKKLNDTGFTVQYATYFFSILPLPIFFFRTIPSRLGFNKNAGAVDKYAGEHKSKGSVLDKLWALELGRIKQGKTIPFGGSCLVVAKKL
jgi:SAM-dependent methyltransferase